MPKQQTKKKVAATIALTVLGAQQVIPVVQSVYATSGTVEIPTEWLNEDQTPKFSTKESMEYALTKLFDSKGYLHLNVTDVVGPLTLQVYGQKVSVNVATNGTINLTGDVPTVQKQLIEELDKHKALKETPTFILYTNKQDDSTSLEGIAFTPETSTASWVKDKEAVYQIEEEVVTYTEDVSKTGLNTPVGTHTSLTEQIKEVHTTKNNNKNFALIETNKGYVELKDLDLSTLPINKETNALQLKVIKGQATKLELDTDVIIETQDIKVEEYQGLLPEGSLIIGQDYKLTFKPKGQAVITSIVNGKNEPLPFTIDKKGLHVDYKATQDGKITIKGSKENPTLTEDKPQLNIKGSWEDATTLDLEDVLQTISVVTPEDATQVQISINDKEIKNQSFYSTGNTQHTFELNQSIKEYGLTEGQTTFDVTVKAGTYTETQTFTITEAVTQQTKPDSQQSTAPTINVSRQQTEMQTQQNITQQALVPPQAIIDAPYDARFGTAEKVDHAWIQVDETGTQQTARVIGNKVTFNDYMTWRFTLNSSSTTDIDTADYGAILYSTDLEGNTTNRIYPLDTDISTQEILGTEYKKHVVRYFDKDGNYTKAKPVLNTNGLAEKYYSTAFILDEEGIARALTRRPEGPDHGNDGISGNATGTEGNTYIGVRTTQEPDIELVFEDQVKNVINGVNWFDGSQLKDNVPEVTVRGYNTPIFKLETKQNNKPKKAHYELTTEDIPLNVTDTISKTFYLSPQDKLDSKQTVEYTAHSLTGFKTTKKVEWDVDSKAPVITQLHAQNVSDLYMDINENENILRSTDAQFDLRFTLENQSVISYVNEKTNGNKMTNLNTPEGMTVKYYNGDTELPIEEDGYVRINKTGIYTVEVINQVGVSSGRIYISDIPKSEFKSSLFINDSDVSETALYTLNSKQEVIQPVGKHKGLDLYAERPIIEGFVTDRGTDTGLLKHVTQVKDFNHTKPTTEETLRTFYERKDRHAELVTNVNTKDEDFDKRSTAPGIYSSINLAGEDVVNERSFDTVDAYAVDTIKPNMISIEEASQPVKQLADKLYTPAKNDLVLKFKAEDKSDNTNVSSGIKSYNIIDKATDDIISTQNVTETGLITVGTTNALNNKVLQVTTTDNAGHTSSPISLSALMGYADDLPLVFITEATAIETTLNSSVEYNGWYKDKLDVLSINATNEQNITKMEITLNGKTIEHEVNAEEAVLTLDNTPALASLINTDTVSGSNTLEIKTYNAVGELDGIDTKTYKVDNTTPTGNITIDKKESDTLTVDSDTSTVYSRKAYNSLIASEDTQSGIAKLVIEGHNIKGTTVTHEVATGQWVLPEDLVSITQLTITDNVGHTTVVQGDGFTYLVDKEKPTIEVNVPKAPYEINGTHYYANTPEVVATIKDNIAVKEASVTTTEIKTALEQLNPKEVKVTTKDVPQGVHELQFQANDYIVTDNATSETVKIAVDEEAPTVKDVELNGQLNEYNGKYITQDKTLTLQLTAEDQLSGVRTIEVLHANELGQTKVIEVDSNGQAILTESGFYSVRLTDNVHNTKVYALSDILVEGYDEILFDNTKPTANVDLEGTLIDLKNSTGQIQRFATKAFNAKVQVNDNIALKTRKFFVNGKETAVDWQQGEANYVIKPEDRDVTGKVTIYTQVEDIAGHKVTTPVQTVYFDTAAPVMTSTTIINSTVAFKEDKTLFKDQLELQFNALDTFEGMSTSGIKAIHVTDAKGKVETLKPNENYIVKDTGVYTFEVEDAVGNKSKAYTFTDLYPSAKSDKLEKYNIEPSLKISAYDKEGQQTTKEYIKDESNIEITTKNDVQVETLTVKVNGQPVTDLELTDGTYSFNTIDQKKALTGVYNIEATLTDVLGQTSVETLTVRIDATDPTITGSDIQGVTGKAYGNIYYQEEVNVTVDVTDYLDSSGYKGVHLYKDGSKVDTLNVVNNKATIKLKEDGDYSFKVEDNVGHTSDIITLGELLETQASTLKKDTNSPAVTMVIDEPTYQTKDKDWYSKGPEAQVALEDAEGIASYSIFINDKWQGSTDQKVYEHNPTVEQDKPTTKKEHTYQLAKYVDLAATDGRLDVRIDVIDVAGNKSSTTKTIYIDTVEPNVTVLGASNIYTNNTTGLYANKEVALTLGLNDYEAASGIKTLDIYDEKGELIQTIDNPQPLEVITIESSGVRKFKVTDNVGNTTELKDLLSVDTAGDFKPEANNVIIDTTYPGIEKEVIELPSGSKEAKVTITEANFNPTSSHIYLDGKELEIKEWNTDEEGAYYVTVTLSKHGLRDLKVHTTDLAGNKTEDEEKIDVLKDIEAGTIGVVWKEKETESGFYTSEQEATIVITEENFDKAKTVVKDGETILEVDWVETAKGVWQTTVIFTEEGAHKLHVYGTDLYGNTYTPSISKEFIIDSIKPELQVTGVEDNTLYTGDTTINVTTSDANYDRVEWSITGIELPTATWYTGSNEAPEAERTNRGTKVVGFALKGSNVLEAHATSGVSAVNNLEAPYTGDAPFPPIDAGGLTLDDIKHDYKVIYINPETGETEEEVILYPNGKPSEDVTVPPTTEGSSSSTDGTTPDGSTGDMNTPEDPRDNVNNDPNNNPAGSYTSKGSTTENNFTIPDIPHAREYDGGYQLTVTSYDKAGNTTTEVKTFGVRRFGTSFAPTYAGAGHFLSDHKGKDFTLHVTNLETDKEVELTQGEDFDIDSTQLNESGQTISNYTIKTDKLEDGNYQGVFKHKETGEEASKVLFTVDTTAPTIKVTGIENDYRTTAKEQKVTIKVTDKLSPDLINVYLEADGQYLEMKQNKGDQTLYTVVLKRTEEPVDFEVTAVDSYGNEIKHKVTNVHIGQGKLLSSFLTIGSIALLAFAFMLGRSNRKDD